MDYPGSERSAKASKTLKGFQVIDDIKQELEKKCPKIVSCADILTAAARDATLLVKGPYWANKYGRKDGRVSIAQEAEQLPKGHENVTALIEFFQSKGLTLLDLVVLSGNLFDQLPCLFVCVSIFLSHLQITVIDLNLLSQEPTP